MIKRKESEKEDIDCGKSANNGLGRYCTPVESHLYPTRLYKVVRQNSKIYSKCSPFAEKTINKTIGTLPVLLCLYNLTSYI